MKISMLNILACAVIVLAASPGSPAQAAASADGERSWHSPSLRTETVTGPNGAVTTQAALLANDKWGIGDTKRVEQVTDGVYAMRGWGIASSFAIKVTVLPVKPSRGRDRTGFATWPWR